MTIDIQPEPAIELDADSLNSKWGFGDGDALSDWWWDNFDEDIPYPEGDVLYALVVEYLKPRLRAAGWDVNLVRIETIHNPVRAESINGREVDWYGSSSVEYDPKITVRVPRSQIDDLMSRLGYDTNHTNGSL